MVADARTSSFVCWSRLSRCLRSLEMEEDVRDAQTYASENANNTFQRIALLALAKGEDERTDRGSVTDETGLCVSRQLRLTAQRLKWAHWLWVWYCGVWCGVKALGRHAPPRAQWPGVISGRIVEEEKKKEHALG